MISGSTSLLRSLSITLEGTAVATKAHKSLIAVVGSWIAELQRDRIQNAELSPGEKPISDRMLPAQHLLTLAAAVFAHDTDTKLFANLNIPIAVWRGIPHTGNRCSPAELQKIWDLVFQAITETSGTTFRFTAARSAQGFLAVPLCSRLRDGRIEELLRFHVWLPDDQRGISDVSIHAHQSYAESWILAGYGENTTYEVKIKSQASDATHATYVPAWSDGGQAGRAYKTHQISSTIVNTGGFAHASKVGKQLHTGDMSYAIPAGECHGSTVPGNRLHATLFFFDSSRGFVEDAKVLGPIDGKEYTQIRDPAGMTPVCLAQLANAARRWEQSHSRTNAQDDEFGIIMSYYNYFTGCALMEANKHQEALDRFNAKSFLPLHMFCKIPSETHRQYIRVLIDAGVDLDGVDGEGFKPLDYAIRNGDAETEALIVRGLRS